MNEAIQEPTPESLLPIDGKTVDVIINQFCRRPMQGDDTPQDCSIGIAENSIVATDGSSAIMIGDPAPLHYATQRKEALLEAERADLYEERVRIEMIPRNVDESTGETRTMMNVQGVISKRMAEMTPVAKFDPDAMIAICKAAKAAGSWEVEIFQEKEDRPNPALGFRIKAPVKSHLMSLFNPWDKPIDIVGIFSVRRAETKQQTLQVADQEGAAKESKSSRKTKKIEVQVQEPNVPQVVDVSELVNRGRKVDIDEVRTRGGMQLPNLSILHSKPPVADAPRGEHAAKIVEVLKGFKIDATVKGYLRGPSITQYQVEIPANKKTAEVSKCADNLKMSLEVTGIRIEAPIPGVNAVGIEVPNQVRDTVYLQDLVASEDFWNSSQLTVAIGKDVSGKLVFANLAEMPHALIAGATGSGKSIGLSTLITSLLMRNTPDELKFVMIDPKRVELTLFDTIPHLLCPVITDVKQAPGVLRAVWREMDRRYELLSEKSVRNIASYNAKVEEDEKLPYIVVVIDELADLMIQARAEVETSLARLGQLARAAGIHLVVATQRPSVDVITGTIKANIPTRIAFATASQVDSRTIIDTPGAETLLGKGDMLCSLMSAPPVRLQGAYMSEDEIQAVVSHWKGVRPACYAYDPSLEASIDDEHPDETAYRRVIEYTRGQEFVSTSMLQRALRLGFQTASRCLDAMEGAGLVSPKDGPRPRTVIGTADDFNDVLADLGDGL